MRLFIIVLLINLASTSKSAFSQENWTAANIKVACFELYGLDKQLHEVVDRMQVFNNERTIWADKNSCDTHRDVARLYSQDVITVNNGRPVIPSGSRNEMIIGIKDSVSVNGLDVPNGAYLFTTDVAIAVSAGGSSGKVRHLGFIGWIETDKYLVSVEKIFNIKARMAAYRASNIYEKKDAALLPECLARVTDFQGVDIVGHQFTSGNDFDYWYKVTCAKPILKNRPIQQRQPQDHSHHPGVVLDANGGHRHGTGPWHQH